MWVFIALFAKNFLLQLTCSTWLAIGYSHFPHPCLACPSISCSCLVAKTGAGLAEETTKLPSPFGTFIRVPLHERFNANLAQPAHLQTRNLDPSRSRSPKLKPANKPSRLCFNAGEAFRDFRLCHLNPFRADNLAMMPIAGGVLEYVARTFVEVVESQSIRNRKSLRRVDRRSTLFPRSSLLETLHSDKRPLD